MLRCYLTLIACGKAQLNILTNLRTKVVEINEIDILCQVSVFMTNYLR